MDPARNTTPTVSYQIAICPDDYTAAGKAPQSDASSPKWAHLLEKAGHSVRWVDVREPDILAQLAGCHGFMWRWAHFAGMSRIARRLLPVIERELGLLVYPSQNTCWHYDDKIAQAYLLSAAGIPIPKTWVWFSRDKALAWAETIDYPVVLKLATGAGSENVTLVPSSNHAKQWIHRLFSRQFTRLDAAQFRPLSVRTRIRLALEAILGRFDRTLHDSGFDSQAGYALFQEFLTGNTHDTRVTVIGRRAFAFRRFNRPHDFRASGSGRISYAFEDIDERFLRLAFETAGHLHSQSCAIDGLYRGTDAVVGEISYTYVSSAVHDCPGHWDLEGPPRTGKLVWIEGQMWPEEAQVEDFLAGLALSQSASTPRFSPN